MSSFWGSPAEPGDSVQSVLWELAVTQPEKVGYIPETRRLYLLEPRASAVSDSLLMRLQDAFYYDVGPLCRLYGFKYLADWRALASKSARETFWGTSFLCNRTFNYFGIWRKNKPWICETFGHCLTVSRTDVVPANFVVFRDFESSLWMFIHTIYSYHFLERLPDEGDRVYDAMAFERTFGVHYWQENDDGAIYTFQLQEKPYTAQELINTWSGHPINNLCANCSPDTDVYWLGQLLTIEGRREKPIIRSVQKYTADPF